MNPLTDFIFIVTWVALLVLAIRSIIKGWAMMREPEPMKNYRQGTWTTEVQKPVHPEMKDVKPGEQLLGVTFEQKTECDLEEYRALQERIEELKSELEDPWDDDEDDDDDGNVPSLTNR